MKVGGLVNWFVIILFSVIFIYYSAEGDHKEPGELLSNMSVHETTFNLTENVLGYTNLYEEEITMKKVVFNIAHPILYGVIVEINTLIPLAIYVASGSYATLLMKLMLLWILLQVFFIIPQIIKASIAIYFFIKEKKRTKEKWWH